MENNKLRLKIQLPDTMDKTIERQPEETKRMKADADYTDMGWQVLGVPFGGPIKGRDLDGEAFHEDTDIWLKTGDKVNITYYHGYDAEKQGEMQPIPALIGRAIYTGADKRGHWFDVMLDSDEPLAQRLIVAGAGGIKSSSGAVSHLLRMGKGGLIDVWPIGEIALFDLNEWRLPANDYAVVEAKSSDIPEVIAEDLQVEPITENVSDGAIEIIEPEIKINKESIMDENIEKVDTPEVVTKADFDAFKTEMLEALKKAEPGEPKGAPTAKAPAVISHRGIPDYRKAYWKYIRTGETTEIDHAKAALQQGTTTEGGYLTPDDEMGSIVAKRDETSIISKLGLRRFTTDRDVFNIPYEDSSMTKFSIVAEEGAISAAENEPTFGQKSVDMYTFTKLIKISKQLLWDENSGLEAFLNEALGRALADTENYYSLIGSGSSQPQGAFVGGTAGLTLDSATAIGPTEIPELMGKLGTPYHNGAVWVMDPATWFYLKGLVSSSVFTFTAGQARLSGTVDGPTLEGYPVVLNSNAAGVGGGYKSLMFGNLNFMAFVTNRNLEVQRLVELYAGNGQVGILATMRFDCEVVQAEAIQYATHPTA